MSVAIVDHTSPEQRLLRFRYGDEEIKFERQARTEGINRVLIKIHPDCRVVVAAPIQIDDADVLRAVKKRSRWIYSKLSLFRDQLQHITPRLYRSGESHYYLGRQYLLKVIGNTDKRSGVKLLRGRLEVFTIDKSAASVQSQLEHWYKLRAKEIFSKRLDSMLEQALWVGSRPVLRTQAMKNQWGSCSPKGALTLNPYLVKAPRACIDYVILHELCHIAEHSHSKKFYRLMSQVMPKWEETKDKLDGMASLILVGSRN